MRDARNAGGLVSLVKLSKDFEPTELVTLVKAVGGTTEQPSPPDDLEPIHATK